VKDGYIERWSSDNKTEILDDVFKIDGTRRFGEAAIGTNYRINRLTRNILYDEKIGGTIHMAIGQSYLQSGGKNESTVHWDMISDMVNGGKIYADSELIYENGTFII
ncbi:MAG: aminopeptidase, partial [Saprospiraceae bacterium]